MDSYLYNYFFKTIFSNWSIVFIALIIISWIIFRLLNIRKCGAVLAFAHLLFSTLFFIIVYIMKYDARVGLIWFIPYQYDIPVSFLFFPVQETILQLLPDTIPILLRLLIAPYLFFAIFGTMQYYVIGRIIDLIIVRIKQ